MIIFTNWNRMISMFQIIVCKETILLQQITSLLEGTFPWDTLCHHAPPVAELFARRPNVLPRCQGIPSFCYPFLEQNGFATTYYLFRSRLQRHPLSV